MARRMVLLLYAVTVCMGLISCEKLHDEGAIRTARQLTVEPLKSLDAIPAEYGNLVGITVNSNWAQLWFEKPDKEIILVSLNLTEGYLANQVLLIPRK